MNTPRVIPARLRSVAWLPLIVAACPLPTTADEPPTAVAGSRPAADPVVAAELEAAIARGVAFLVADQNADGSFGTPRRTKDLVIIAGVGSHHGFRAASTALAVQALVEEDDGSPEVARAIDRGEAWLVAELPRVRRHDAMLIYNIWAHAYGIQVLAALHGRNPGDAARRARLEELIRGQYELLGRYESVEGGWGYYDFNAGTQRPNSSSQSFVNAAVLVAFHDAKRIGVAPPEKLVKRAVEATKLQQMPDFSYLYGSYLKWQPRREVNRPAGSLGRSQACNLALRLWGDEAVTAAVLEEWLDRLVDRNGWLEMGRKRPVPHESFAQVAGYFYYFGHYYAARVIDELPAASRPRHQDALARIILSVQDADGSWWDFPLYDYHQQYGTGYALMTLHRCRKAKR